MTRLLLAVDGGPGPLGEAAQTWLGALDAAGRLFSDEGAGELFDRLALRARVARGSLAPSPFLRLGPQGYEIFLPCDHGGPDALDEMSPSAPFWSRDELALYVVLHEAGHAAHFGAPAEISLGDQASPARELLADLGALDAGDPHGQALLCVFQESYADCFAALTMGAHGPLGARERAEQILRFRARNIPAAEADYGQGDIEHDSREALRQLIEDLHEPPRSGAQIERACLRAATLGSLRWAQALASRGAGRASWMLWARASQRAAHACQARQQRCAGDFERLRDAAMDCEDFNALASDMGETGQSKPALALGLRWLLRMRELGGAPRGPLRGQRPAPAQGKARAP